MAVQAAVPAAIAVAPPLDVTLRLLSEQMRDDGTTPRRFTMVRDLTFSAEQDGYRVTVIMRSAEAAGDKGESARFTAANRRLIGRPIIIHLDQQGALRSVGDLAQVWADWTAGLADVAPRGVHPEADRMRDSLAAMPDARRAAIVGAVATDLFADPADRVVTPPHPVQLASHPPFANAAVTGIGSVLADGGELVVRVTASGAATASPPATLSTTIERRIGIATGLIATSLRTDRTTVAGHTIVVKTRATLTTR